MPAKRRLWNKNPLRVIADGYREIRSRGFEMSNPAYSMTGSFPTEETTALTDFKFYLNHKRNKENYRTCIGGHRVLQEDFSLVSCLICSPKWDTRAFDECQPKSVVNNAKFDCINVKFEVASTDQDIQDIIDKRTRNLTSTKPLMRVPSILIVPTFNQDENTGQYAELPIREGTRCEIYHAVITYYHDKFKTLSVPKGTSKVDVHSIMPAGIESVDPYYYFLVCTIKLNYIGK